MSQAEELLNTLYMDETASHTTDAEPYIVVNSDRTIIIPEELKRIAVQHDHNVETVTFSCPRYWDAYDFSEMHVYINYERPDGYKDQYPVKNLRVNETDDTLINFEWTISRNVTKQRGNISLLVCIKSNNDNGEEEIHWNSRLNNELVVDPGLECSSQVAEEVPDVIEECLTRLERLEEMSTLEIRPVTNGVYYFDLESTGLPAVSVDGSEATIYADCSKLREVLVDQVIKVRIPINASGVKKYITAFSLAEYQKDTDIYQISMTGTTYTDDQTTTYIVNIDVGISTISVSVFELNNANETT